MFVHKHARAQYGQYSAGDTSSDEEEEEGDILQVKIEFLI